MTFLKTQNYSNEKLLSGYQLLGVKKSLTIKGKQGEDWGVDRMVLYIDCDSSYTN